VAFKIYTADLGFGDSDKARVFGEVWRECFNEYAREFCYMADCADLSFTWNLCLNNLEMEWQGYSDSLPLYVLETLKRMVTMKDADLSKIFWQVKEQLMQ
jgi:secreted Zn-dependent insulinase-like peptidase